MTQKLNHTIACVTAAALMLVFLGCGEDPSIYENETLTFESPVSAKVTKESDKTADLDLKDGSASDFHFVRYGIMAPWVYPLFDYYLEPIPVEVPVSPFYSVIDFVHPMYFDYFAAPWEDDDGHHHSRDDDE